MHQAETQGTLGLDLILLSMNVAFKQEFYKLLKLHSANINFRDSGN
jgi:hypothetical protein